MKLDSKEQIYRYSPNRYSANSVYRMLSDKSSAWLIMINLPSCIGDNRHTLSVEESNCALRCIDNTPIRETANKREKNDEKKEVNTSDMSFATLVVYI